jgi:uncharacterized glyoxalase superfamily protein PhnB
MTKSISVQLAFHGQCRQAFELYELILDGTISVMNTFGDSDAKAASPMAA